MIVVGQGVESSWVGGSLGYLPGNAWNTEHWKGKKSLDGPLETPISVFQVPPFGPASPGLLTQVLPVGRGTLGMQACALTSRIAFPSMEPWM